MLWILRCPIFFLNIVCTFYLDAVSSLWCNDHRRKHCHFYSLVSTLKKLELLISNICFVLFVVWFSFISFWKSKTVFFIKLWNISRLICSHILLNPWQRKNFHHSEVVQTFLFISNDDSCINVERMPLYHSIPLIDCGLELQIRLQSFRLVLFIFEYNTNIWYLSVAIYCQRSTSNKPKQLNSINTFK